jgi:hypothetical protein
MTDTTCPSLAELGIEPGSFLRKLDNRNHWNSFTDQEDLAVSAQEVAERVFKEKGAVYSLWKVNTDQELYGVVASLTTYANPKDRNIDFICLAVDELEEAGVEPKNVPEGNCLRVKNLHFDAVIIQKSARLLCFALLSRKRIALRCGKSKTKLILQHQLTLGCKAAGESSQACDCEAE